MKTILVDAVDCIMRTNGELFEEMRDMLDELPNRKLVLTNADDQQFKQFNLDLVPYEVFSLKHNPEKTDPAYYKSLLEQYGLEATGVAYFEHNPDAVASAQQVGIVTYFYDSTTEDLASLRAFLLENL